MRHRGPLCGQGHVGACPSTVGVFAREMRRCLLHVGATGLPLAAASELLVQLRQRNRGSTGDSRDPECAATVFDVVTSLSLTDLSGPLRCTRRRTYIDASR